MRNRDLEIESKIGSTFVGTRKNATYFMTICQIELLILGRLINYAIIEFDIRQYRGTCRKITSEIEFNFNYVSFTIELYK